MPLLVHMFGLTKSPIYRIDGRKVKYPGRYAGRQAGRVVTNSTKPLPVRLENSIFGIAPVHSYIIQYHVSPLAAH